MAENLPNLGKKTDIQVQEEPEVPNEVKPRISVPRQIVIKISKVKEKFLKTAREKQITFIRKLYKVISRFLSRNFAGQKEAA